MKVIRTKAQMYELLQRGQFGNIAPQWNSLDDAIDGAKAFGKDAQVSLRSREITNPLKMYHVPVHELRQRVAALPQYQTQGGIVYSLAPPDQFRTIQGEVSYTTKGFTFDYTTVGLPMRLAFLEERIGLTGTAALMKFRAAVPPADVDRILEILATYGPDLSDPFAYPRIDTVIEFSAFSVPFGTVPGSRVLIWEVRNY